MDECAHYFYRKMDLSNLIWLRHSPIQVFESESDSNGEVRHALARRMHLKNFAEINGPSSAVQALNGKERGGTT